MGSAGHDGLLLFPGMKLERVEMKDRAGEGGQAGMGRNRRDTECAGGSTPGPRRQAQKPRSTRLSALPLVNRPVWTEAGSAAQTAGSTAGAAGKVERMGAGGEGLNQRGHSSIREKHPVHTEKKRPQTPGGVRGAQHLCLHLPSLHPVGGHTNPLQCPCLENPMDRGAGGLQSMGLQRSETT